MMSARRTAVALAVVVVYVIAGKIGLQFAFLHASATPIWPPAGIALAALLRLGYSLWPAVFVGAFVVNVTTAGSVALTGYGLLEDRERALAAGFDAHVVKPVDLDELRAILAEP